MTEAMIIALIPCIPSLITIIITAVTNNKVKKQEKITEQIQKLDKKTDNNRMKTLRNILVNEYTELTEGKRKSKEQLQDIAEMFEEYKSLGGDTYVDDLHDIWKEQESRRRES